MDKGIIAAGHKETARIGAEILKAGGNAFDAAIGAMIAACVCESATISLGGGGFLLAQQANQKTTLYDFFTQTPSNKKAYQNRIRDFYKIPVNFGDTVQYFHVGLASMAVPGNVAGAFYVHQQLGRMPFNEIVQPTIDLAKKGMPLDAFQVDLLHMLQPIVLNSDIGKSIFADEKGNLKKEGAFVKIPHIDDALYYLANNGPREFYEGEMAQKLVQDCAEKGGFLTIDDMKNYRVIERKPLEINYRNYTLLTNPPPSAGGALIAFSLALLNRYNLKEKYTWGSKEHLRLLAEVMQVTNEARAKGFDHLIQQPEVQEAFLGHENVAFYAEKVASKVGSTTQISVADAKGNSASLTLSSGEGTGYYIPNTGIMMNNMLGEEDLNPNGFHQWVNNQRMSSMMAPTIMCNEKGLPIVLGSSGSNRIRTAIVQVLSNIVDFGMPIKIAVQAQRLHTENKVASFEKGWNENVIESIRFPNDWKKNSWQKRSMFFGGVNAVLSQQKTTFAGAGDNRRNGQVVLV